jgi:enoyl-CoA hydratase
MRIISLLENWRDTILIEISEQEQVTVLTMKYGTANAQNLEFCREITSTFEELRRSSTRAVVLTGQGRIFCAGVDLVRLTNEGAAYVEEFLPALSKMFETIFFFPKPVIAAVNGHAIAGGCVLACAADYRVMAQGNGRSGVPELLVGVPFPAVALEILRLVCSPLYLAELLYTGANVSPEVAQQYGLVNKIVEPGNLMEQALKIATNMAALPPTAFALAKAQIHAPAFSFLRENGEGVDEEVVKQWSSPETLDGIRAYIARTFKKSEG